MDEYFAIVDAIRRDAQDRPPVIVTVPKTSPGVVFDVVDETNGGR